MATYLAILLTALIGIFGLLFKKDENDKKQKGLAHKLTGGGWIILILLLISLAVSLYSARDDKAKDLLRYNDQRQSFYKIDSLQKLTVILQDSNYEHQIQLMTSNAENLNFKLEKSNDKLKSVESKSEAISQDLLETGYPLFPITVELSFVREAVCEDGYNYNTRDLSIMKTSKKSILFLANKLLENLKNEKVPSGFKIDGKADDIAIHYPNFRKESQDTEYSITFRQLNIALASYLPKVDLIFLDSLQINKGVNDFNLIASTHIDGSELIPTNIYNLDYFSLSDKFEYYYQINDFFKYEGKRAVKSIYSLSHGIISIRLGSSADESFYFQSGLTFSFRAFDPKIVRYFSPLEGVGSLKQCRHIDRFTISADSIIAQVR